MSGEPLIRTSYRDPYTGVVRSGDPAYSEVNVDVEQYHQPLERVHGSGPHSFGVAGGLGVTAVDQQKGIKVQPGVAIDAPGRHISLGVGGQAQVGTTTDNAGNTVPAGLVTCAPDGVPCDTTGMSGDFYVTIQWYETFDYKSLTGQNPLYNIDDTPWIQFQVPGSFTADGYKGIILARLSLDNAGNVTALTEDQRFTAGLRAGAIRIPRGDASGPDPVSHAVSVGDTVSAGLDPLPAGGLDVSVPGSADEIHLHAANGNFANLDVSATRITARHPNGAPSIGLETDSATALLGLDGQAGHVDVRGPNNQYSVFLNGEDGHIITGGPGLTGEVRVKDAEASDTIHLEGGAGDLWYTGSLLDPNNAHPPVTHDKLRQLTTGVLTDLHRHHTSDASEPFVAGSGSLNWMYCFSFGQVQATISLPNQAFIFASIVITSVFPINGAVDSDDALIAEIYRVDGRDYRWGGYLFGNSKSGGDGDDRNVRSPVFEGVAQTITFRLRSTDDCEVGALAIVYMQP